jgi:hypothetical protein
MAGLIELDRTKKGWLQPEVEYVQCSLQALCFLILCHRYVYDMLVPQGKEDDPDYTPKPFDGEAESFDVCSSSQVDINLTRLQAAFS